MAFPIIGAVALAAIAFLALAEKSDGSVEPKCLLDAGIPTDLADEVNRQLSVSIARESWTTQLDAAAAALAPFYPMAAGCLRARAAELRGK